MRAEMFPGHVIIQPAPEEGCTLTKRIIARTKARELTPEETGQITGGWENAASFAPTETEYATNIGPNGDTEKRFDY